MSVRLGPEVSRGYKSFFMLNSTEHEILTAHKNEHEILTAHKILSLTGL